MINESGYAFDSNLLKELRVRHDITQGQLADLCQVTQATVSMWEKSQREPSLMALQHLARVFNVPVELFLLDPQSSQESADETKDKLADQSKKLKMIHETELAIHSLSLPKKIKDAIFLYAKLRIQRYEER